MNCFYRELLYQSASQCASNLPVHSHANGGRAAVQTDGLVIRRNCRFSVSLKHTSTGGQKEAIMQPHVSHFVQSHFYLKLNLLMYFQTWILAATEMFACLSVPNNHWMSHDGILYTFIMVSRRWAQRTFAFEISQQLLDGLSCSLL